MSPKKPTQPREDPQQYVLRKNYKKAIELYRAMVKEADQDANVALRLADVLVLDNQVPTAVQEYKRAARLYGEQGFLLKAIGVNKKIVKLDPRQHEVHESLSKLYQEKGLLAKPEVAASAAPGASGIDFGMEEASDSSEDLDLRLNLGEVAVPEPEPELGADDFAADAPEPEPELTPAEAGLDGPDLAPGLDPLPTELTGMSFDFSAPAAAAGAASPAEASSSALGGFDFGRPDPASGGGEPPDALPEDISLDALGDALSDELTPDLAASALQSLSDFGGDLLGSPDLAPDAVEPAAARPPLFSDLTPDEFVEVVSKLAHQAYPPGAAIVREGDPGDALFVIVTGQVRVTTSAKGAQIQLATMGEGDFFGEGSLITGKPRTATITAEQDCELLCLSRAALDEIAEKHPRVRQVMREFYEQRARSTVQTILKLSKLRK